MTTPFLLPDLQADEGYAALVDKRDPNGDVVAYPDPESEFMRTGKGAAEPWTCGFGCCFDLDGSPVTKNTRWTRAHALDVLNSRVDVAKHDCDLHMPWWRAENDVRQDVAVQLMFNMGWGKLRGFVDTLAAWQDGKWACAAEELLDSLWAKQVGERRSGRLSRQLASGVHE